MGALHAEALARQWPRSRGALPARARRLLRVLINKLLPLFGHVLPMCLGTRLGRARAVLGTAPAGRGAARSAA